MKSAKLMLAYGKLQRTNAIKLWPRLNKQGRRNHHLRLRIDRQEQLINAKGASAATTPIPETLDDFETWCTTHLAGYVEIHNRAFQGIKKSQYEDVSLNLQIATCVAR